MYGTGSTEFPERVVCLTAETVEIAYRVGAGERVQRVGCAGHDHERSGQIARGEVGVAEYIIHRAPELEHIGGRRVASDRDGMFSVEPFTKQH